MFGTGRKRFTRLYRNIRVENLGVYAENEYQVPFVLDKQHFNAYVKFVNLSFKYRIYLNKEQAAVFEKNLEFCRILYNAALQESISYYKKFGTGTTYNKQSAVLPGIKRLFVEEASTIYSQSLQQVFKRLHKAYANFFRRVKAGETAGFPRYKSFNRHNSILFPQPDPELASNSGGIKLLSNNKLKVFGIPGEIKVVWHRPFQGRCKQVSIKKQAGKYYIILSCDDVPTEPLPKTEKTIAIDLGINSFITDHTGKQEHHPKPYRTAKEKLAFCNRRLAAKKRGSNNRKEALKLLQKASEKVHNVRTNFQHKLANKLLKENDTIIIEKLNIQKMMKEGEYKVLKQNISDASWGSFAAILNYKAEKAGKQIIEVDPKNTSKMCFNCKHIKEELLLSNRIYNCVACGNSMDRDHNAALNIYRLGMSLATAKKAVSEALAFTPR